MPDGAGRRRPPADAPPPIRVGVSSAAGHGERGVFATRDISQGELIEAAPVIVIPRADSARVCLTCLDDYVFKWGGGCVAVALGCGSLYNHSFEPNACYWQDTPGRALEFVALRAIAAGDEITINYNGNPGDRRALWFPTRDL